MVYESGIDYDGDIWVVVNECYACSRKNVDTAVRDAISNYNAFDGPSQSSARVIKLLSNWEVEMLAKSNDPQELIRLTKMELLLR